jgi:hypothetical protein
MALYPPTVPYLASGDILTATRYNNPVTAIQFLMNPPQVQATNVAGTSYANTVRAIVPFASEDFDTGATWDGAMHDNTTNNSRVIATTPGTYRIEARLGWTPNATGRRLLDITKNSAGSFVPGNVVLSTGIAYAPTATDTCYLEAHGYISMAANDYLEAWGLQTSGGALTLVTPVGANYLNIRWIGN